MRVAWIFITILLSINFSWSSDFFEGYVSGTFDQKKIDHSFFQDTYKIQKEIKENETSLVYNYRFYRAKHFRKNKLVIIFPSIAEETFIEKSMAFYFYSRGYDVLVDLITTPEMDFNDDTVKWLDIYYKREVVSVKFTLDSLEKLYNYENYFLLGGSKGGIRSMSYVGYDHRIDAAWIVAAGGDLSEVYAFSENEIISIFRQNHMRALNIEKVGVYHRFLQENLEFGPLKICLNRRARVYANITLKDSVIPTKIQKSMAEHCQAEKTRDLPLNHILGVVSQMAYKNSILRFFKRSTR